MSKILIDEATVRLVLGALEGLEALLLSMGLTHLIVYGDAEKAITNLQKQLEDQPAQQEPAGWRPATFHRDNLTFNPGLPDEQTVKFWKLQGVEIEYCYTIPQPAQRTWVSLTDGEIWASVGRIGTSDSDVNPYAILTDARAIEAKLRSKNEDRN